MSWPLLITFIVPEVLLTVSFISPKVASRAFALKRGSDLDFTKFLEIINPDPKKKIEFERNWP